MCLSAYLHHRSGWVKQCYSSDIKFKRSAGVTIGGGVDITGYNSRVSVIK